MAAARVIYGIDQTIYVEFTDVEGLSARSEEEETAKKVRLDRLLDLALKLRDVTNVTINDEAEGIIQCSMVVQCSTGVKLLGVGTHLRIRILQVVGTVRFIT